LTYLDTLKKTNSVQCCEGARGTIKKSGHGWQKYKIILQMQHKEENIKNRQETNASLNRKT